MKEKRVVVKNLLSKIRNRFNVAVAKVGEQNIHQTIVIGVATVVSHSAQVDSVMGEIRYFIGGSTGAKIIDMEREIF